MNEFCAIITSLHQLPLEEAYTKIAQFVKDCHGDSDTIRLLVESYDKECKAETQSFRLGMFLYCEKEIIEEVITALKVSPELYYYELVNLNDSDLLLRYCEKMKEILQLSREQWQFLLDKIQFLQENEGFSLDGQLRLCHEQLYRFAYRQLELTKPSWLVAKDDTESLPTDIPEPYVAVNSSFEISMKEFSKELAREYGILNKRKSLYADFDPNHVCCKHGGCRMLTCNEFHRYVEDNFDFEQELEWFTGKCDCCKKSIPFRHWSIREPLLNGGWIGCFCSFHCLEKGASEDHPFQLELFRHILYGFGIYDREE